MLARIFLLFAGIFISFKISAQSSTWEEALRSKRATFDILWCQCDPFFRNENGALTGVEFEILVAFKEFVKSQHKVDLTFRFDGTNAPEGILQALEKSTRPNILGTSLFSINEERAKIFALSDSYMAEVTVMVTSQYIPTLIDEMDISRHLKNSRAYTIQGTTLEELVQKTSTAYDLSLDIIYRKTTGLVLTDIQNDSSSLAFVDLPVYLDWVHRGVRLSRQPVLSHKGDGYGFILPKNSDWVYPMNEFLNNPETKSLIREIISRQFGPGFYEFMESLPTGNELGYKLLAHEKEIQRILLENANLKINNQETSQRLLLIGLIISGLLILIIGVLLWYNVRNNKKLIRQNIQIENQKKDILEKNDMLVSRNMKLIELHEDRKNLISVLAHDLRTPLFNIMALEDMSEHDKAQINKEQYMYDEFSRMQSMLDKFLNPSIINGQELTVNKEKFNLIDTISTLQERFEPISKKKGIRFITNRNFIRQEVETDQMLVYLIIDNLVTNAFKYSYPNTEVTLIISTTDDEMILNIKDQGQGFSDDDKKLIFGRFQKLSAKPTGNESSVGLGLSLVKKYVQDLEGHIELQSKQGVGSEFIVRIPA